MPNPFQHAALRLTTDETFTKAVETVLSLSIQRILKATTPEDREEKFQEYQGLKRAWALLEKEAVEAKPKD